MPKSVQQINAIKIYWQCKLVFSLAIPRMSMQLNSYHRHYRPLHSYLCCSLSPSRRRAVHRNTRSLKQRSMEKKERQKAERESGVKKGGCQRLVLEDNWCTLLKKVLLRIYLYITHHDFTFAHTFIALWHFMRCSSHEWLHQCLNNLSSSRRERLSESFAVELVFTGLEVCWKSVWLAGFVL